MMQCNKPTLCVISPEYTRKITHNVQRNYLNATVLVRVVNSMWTFPRIGCLHTRKAPCHVYSDVVTPGVHP
jgi:hypothetical protein